MTTSADNRIDELISRVKRRSSMSDIAFIPAYPPHKTPNPMGRYTVTVGDIEVKPSRYFIGDRVGRGEEGMLAEVVLRLRVYAPERTAGASLIRVTSMLVDALDAEDTERWIRSFKLSDIGFDTASRTEFRDLVVHLYILLSEEVAA